MLSRFLPPAASAHAGAIDAMLEHVHLMVLVLFAGWAAYFIYVLLRFRSGAHPKANPAGTSGRFAMAAAALGRSCASIFAVSRITKSPCGDWSTWSSGCGVSSTRHRR